MQFDPVTMLCFDCGGSFDAHQDAEGAPNDFCVDRLKTQLAELKAEVESPHFGARMIAISLAETLKGAQNFIEQRGTIPDVGEVVFTIQRADGKSPGARVAELEAQLAEVRDRFEKLDEDRKRLHAALLDALAAPDGTDVVESIRRLRARTMPAADLAVSPRAATRFLLDTDTLGELIGSALRAAMPKGT